MAVRTWGEVDFEATGALEAVEAGVLALDAPALAGQLRLDADLF